MPATTVPPLLLFEEQSVDEGVTVTVVVAPNASSESVASEALSLQWLSVTRPDAPVSVSCPRAGAMSFIVEPGASERVKDESLTVDEAILAVEPTLTVMPPTLNVVELVSVTVLYASDAASASAGTSSAARVPPRRNFFIAFSIS